MPNENERARCWRVGPGLEVRLDGPILIGILNATPDSFSDGGTHVSTESLRDAALRMADDGAAIIDIGGESTRPGADRISVAEQIDRTTPVVEAVRRVSDVLVSIDTTRARVAASALDAGANIINDVAAALEDPEMLSLAAARECGLILMHRRVAPNEDSYSHEYAEPPEYDDVVTTVREFLLDRACAARDAGVSRDAIVLDPGLGFGKTVDQNFELISRTRDLAASGYPVLGAASRKSFVGVASGIAEPRDRMFGSVAVSVAQYLEGARLFRVHDVAAHREALAVIRVVDQAREPVG